MATDIRAIPTLFGEDARRFGEAALESELRYDPARKKELSERRKNARILLKKAGIISSI